MMESESFWGDIGTTDVRTPVSLLREQASMLGEKTRYVIEAKVETRTSKGYFIHSLTLVVPSMDQYEYEVLRIRHGINIYPVIDFKTLKELDDEESFLDWLRQQLSSPQIKKVIGNLMALANS